MDTHKKIMKTSQAMAHLERQLAIEKIKKRKAETRRKIAWGGLIVKANMDDYSKEMILGALIQARKAIEKEPATQWLYQSIGKSAWMGYGDDNSDTTP